MGKARLMRLKGGKLARQPGGLAAALVAAVTLDLSWAAADPVRAQSRMMTYGSEAECTQDRILSAAICKSAFANARAEFEAKTRAFAAKALCVKAFGTCAPWPPGAPKTKGPGLFRPAFDGVEILDTPKEKSVLPLLAGAGHAVAFMPRPLTAPIFEPAPTRQAALKPGLPHAFRAPAPEPDRPPPQTAPPPPGSGFVLKNGVLTYPAPARFAPRNLPQQSD